MDYTIKKIAPVMQEYTDPWVVFDANNSIVYAGQDKQGCEWYIDDMLNRKGHWFSEMIPHYFGDYALDINGKPKFFPTQTAEQSHAEWVKLETLERSMPRGVERRTIGIQAFKHYSIYKKELQNYCLEETA
jgi:hypothetical protein